MNNERYIIKKYRTEMHYLSLLVVLYTDNRKPWVLLPWNNTINGLHHYQVIGDTLILCHETKGLYKYCLITQTLLSHLVYPEGFEVSSLDDKNYNETADKLLLQGRVRYIDDEGEGEEEDLILIIVTSTLQIEKQAHDLEKKYRSVAIQHKEKPHLWSMASYSLYDKYGFQEDLLTYDSKEESYTRVPFKSQQGSSTHSAADTWISPSGTLVVRTKYGGLSIISKNGKRHIQHKVEVFPLDDTFSTRELVVYNREEEFVGYLHEMPEELEKKGRGNYPEEKNPLEEWQDLWRKIAYSKQAYAVYKFARYTPWIHKPLCYLWNKTHSTIVEKDDYSTPIKEIIDESDRIHNDLYVVTWEKDEKAFWVLFRGGFLRRVSLDGTLFSLFKIGGNIRSKLQTPFDHYGKLNINDKGIIEVVEGLCENFSDVDFSFDPNSYDMDDENKLILLNKEDDITKKDVINKLDEEYIENSVLSLLALTIELKGELTTEYIREKIGELRGKLKNNLDDYIHQYYLMVVFQYTKKFYSEDYFFKNNVNDASLLPSLKELLDTYLNALSTAKRRTLYKDEDTPSLQPALDAYIRLSNREKDKYIPQELYEQISKWMRYYYYYLEIPIFKRYAIDEKWLELSFTSEMTAPYVNMWVGRWKEKDRLYIYENFSNKSIADIFIKTFESLWDEVILRKIKADPYSEFSNNDFSQEEVLIREKILKKETYKHYISDYFNDELQEILHQYALE